MFRILCSFIFSVLASSISFAKDRPPDDLTGMWVGVLSCKPAKGRNFHYDAELTFVPTDGAWIGRYELKKPGVNNPFAVVEFDANINENNRGSSTDITISDIRLTKNINEISFGDISASFHIKSGIHYAWFRLLDLDGVGGKCSPPTAMRYRNGSGEKILENSGESPVSREINEEIRRKLFRCNEISSVESLASCFIDSEKLSIIDSSANFLSRKYMESVIYRARSNMRSASCAEDTNSIAEFQADLRKSGFGGAYEPKTCEDISLVFRLITGVPENYAICADIMTYSRENFVSCLNKLWAIKGARKAAPLYQKLTGSSDWDVHQGLDLGQLWDAGFRPDAYLDTVRTPFLKILSDCNAGRPLHRNPNLLVDAFANALTFGYRDDDPIRPNHQEIAASVTCADAAHFFLANGMVDQQEVQALLASDGDLDLCGINRPTTAPTLDEVKATSAALALENMCSRRMFQFAVSVVGLDANFRVSDGICKMDVYGLPIVSLGYRFIPSACTNKGSGQSECRGPVEVYCTAADRSRQPLDCLGKNAAYDTTFSYSYDTKGCKWDATSISVDLESARLIEGLRH